MRVEKESSNFDLIFVENHIEFPVELLKATSFWFQFYRIFPIQSRLVDIYKDVILIRLRCTQSRKKSRNTLHFSDLLHCYQEDGLAKRTVHLWYAHQTQRRSRNLYIVINKSKTATASLLIPDLITRKIAGGKTVNCVFTPVDSNSSTNILRCAASWNTNSRNWYKLNRYIMASLLLVRI